MSCLEFLCKQQKILTLIPDKITLNLKKYYIFTLVQSTTSDLYLLDDVNKNFFNLQRIVILYTNRMKNYLLNYFFHGIIILKIYVFSVFVSSML